MAFDENLSRYPQERADILDFILKNKIGGVVFLTGDRHFGEFSVLNGRARRRCLSSHPHRSPPAQIAGL